MKELNNDLGQEKDEVSQGKLFGRILDVPEELLALDRTRLALYMIVQSSKITSQRAIAPEFELRLGQHAASLKQNYFKIYLENSSNKRLVFFCEPLIQHLWAHYRNQNEFSFQQYLAEVKMQPQGRNKVKKLIQDVSLL